MCRARTGAVKYFGLISRPVPGFQVPHPRIGEEAIRGTQKLTLNPRWDCSPASLPNYDHDAARGTRLRPIPIHQHLEPLVGGPLDVTSRHNGSTVSTCALLAKGREVSGYEGEARFVGVLAPFASVLDASSVGGAEKYFRLISGVLPPGYLVTHPEHIGEEAVLFTKTTTNAVGEAEYGSIMMVRVQNIVAQISLVSTPGDSEADPAQSLKLLTRVTRTL
jgi:hypothetical protein